MLKPGSLSRVSRTYGVSLDSLRRHARNHGAPELRRALEHVSGLGPLTVAARIQEIADAARDARLSAYSSGNPALGIKAGDAEARALYALSDRFGINSTRVTEELAELETFVLAMVRLVEVNPAAAVALADVFDRLDRPDIADAIRDRLKPISRN